MYNKITKMTQEQLRMQMLAGVITESQYKEKIEEEENPTIPLDATTKRYVIKRLKEILDEYDEEGIEELQNAGFFEQDFEEELVVEFGDDYDAVNVSPELSDFISNLAY